MKIVDPLFEFTFRIHHSDTADLSRLISALLSYLAAALTVAFPSRPPSAKGVRLALAVLVLIPSLATASPKQDPENKLPKMLRSTGAELNRVYDLIEARKLSSAREKLLSLRTKVKNRRPDLQYIERALGYIYLEEDNLSGAKRHLANALEEEIFPAEVYHSTTVDLAQLYFVNNEYKAAVNLLKPLLSSPQKNSLQINKLLGASLMELGHYREAIDHLEKVAKASKKLDRGLGLTLVSAYSHLKLYIEAGQTLERLLLLNPRDHEVWRQLAQMLYLGGDAERASARYYLAYEKGLVTSREDIIFLTQLQAEAGIPLLGIEILTEALDKTTVKRDSATYRLLAQLHSQAQNHRESAQYFEKIYSLNNRDLASLLSASQLYLHAEELKDAVRTSETLLKAKEIRDGNSNSSRRMRNSAKQVLEQVQQIEQIAVMEEKYLKAKQNS